MQKNAKMNAQNRPVKPILTQIRTENRDPEGAGGWGYMRLEFQAAGHE